MKDDKNVFFVMIGVKMVVLEGEEIVVEVSMKDIKIENFLVFVCGKELLKNMLIIIVYGWWYGLVGLNGIGKFILLKFLVWC